MSWRRLIVMWWSHMGPRLERPRMRPTCYRAVVLMTSWDPGLSEHRWLPAYGIS